MKELQVTYSGLGGSFLLGTLAQDQQDLLFQYSPQALERQWELSPLRLPLRAGAYPDRRMDYAQLHGVPGLICDSLPDGWGNRRSARKSHARFVAGASQRPAFDQGHVGAGSYRHASQFAATFTIEKIAASARI